MKAPNKIYIDESRITELGGLADAIVPDNRIETSDVCYIRKDALQQEQQEVDLDADIEMEWDSFNKHLAEYGEESEDVVWLNWYNFNELARNFYELGLKARKE